MNPALKTTVEDERITECDQADGTSRYIRFQND